MSYKSRWIVGLFIFSIWLVSTVYAFWWFQYRDLRPFDTLTSGERILFNEQLLTQGLQQLNIRNDGNPGITLVHFWNPECSCDRFNRSHLQELISHYGKHGIRFVIAVNRSHIDEVLIQRAEKSFGNIPVISTHASHLNTIVASTPAAAILTADNSLAYFGPYSSGAVCSVSSGQFVEKVLETQLQGNNPHQVNTLTFGCYCDWNPKKNNYRQAPKKEST